MDTAELNGAVDRKLPGAVEGEKLHSRTADLVSLLTGGTTSAISRLAIPPSCSRERARLGRETSYATCLGCDRMYNQNEQSTFRSTPNPFSQPSCTSGQTLPRLVSDWKTSCGWARPLVGSSGRDWRPWLSRPLAWRRWRWPSPVRCAGDCGPCRTSSGKQ